MLYFANRHASPSHDKHVANHVASLSSHMYTVAKSASALHSCIVRDPTAKTLARNDIQADTFSRGRNQLPRDSAVPTQLPNKFLPSEPVVASDQIIRGTNSLINTGCASATILTVYWMNNQEMSSITEHGSSVPLPSFTFPTLPPESNTTRMIRLLPHENENARIECELFDYSLSEMGDGKHLYEALSYVWGSDIKPRSIILNGCDFPVTENLHTALLYLRNRQLGRTLWVDAISIDQDNQDEKTRQIPLMRAIYAQAAHVIVWLGEATGNDDKAIEGIRCLAQGQDTGARENHDICLGLLQRAWFHRIWVR